MKNGIVISLIFVVMTTFVICTGAMNAQTSSHQAPPSTDSTARIVKRWSWSGYEHVVFEVDGHQYLEARGMSYHDNVAISVIHYESCPCKEKPNMKNL